jgi:hypothetical protein
MKYPAAFVLFKVHSNFFIEFFQLCTAAGMSPFQNGLCEHVHAITDIMLIKLAAENKNVEIETLLSWANMARNSLHNKTLLWWMCKLLMEFQ